VTDRRPTLPPPDHEPTRKYQQLLDACRPARQFPPAVVHPCDRHAIGRRHRGPHALGLISPILIGPEARIRARAALAGIDLAGIPIVDVPHSHARGGEGGRARAAGQGRGIMKGSLHTDELMGAVVRPEAGLRTARRISHCFVHGRAGIRPSADHFRPPRSTSSRRWSADRHRAERDRSAHAPALSEVRVAILSATETVNPKVPSTSRRRHCARWPTASRSQAACSTARSRWTHAISPAAASIKQIDSPVAGQANVLIVPDMEAGNMLAKSLSFLAQADAAGIRARRPRAIILTSRADSELARLGSCACAVLVALARRTAPPKALA